MTHSTKKSFLRRLFPRFARFGGSRVGLIFIASSVWAAPASADLQAGIAAYNVGAYSRAADAWHRSASEGDASSQFRLAELYESGMGVVRNGSTAVRWYSRAADQGHLEAQFRLGVLLEFGRALPRDISRASHWYLRAAENGHPVACARMGAFFEVRANNVQALLWYREAVIRGHEFAEILIPAVQAKLAPEELELVDSGKLKRQRHIGKSKSGDEVAE